MRSFFMSILARPLQRTELAIVDVDGRLTGDLQASLHTGNHFSISQCSTFPTLSLRGSICLCSLLCVVLHFLSSLAINKTIADRNDSANTTSSRCHPVLLQSFWCPVICTRRGAYHLPLFKDSIDSNDASYPCKHDSIIRSCTPGIHCSPACARPAPAR